jgi:acetamidase/formamidase
VTQHLDRHGYSAFTGIGPDLMTAARDAVSYTIDALCREQGCRRKRPIGLPVCGDLRISEIVDRPNWVVSFYFPNSVFN